MKLIVGLGNIGNEYDKTRHNVGFMIVDHYLKNAKFSEKDNALYYKTTIGNEQVLFIKPTTYMNNSGIAVRKFVDYYNIDISDVLVIQDDLDIEFGHHKLKMNSSSGGHNGIKSIISHLNTDGFLRLKIGIKNDNISNTIDFVLSRFNANELKKIEENMDVYGEIINSFINNGIEKTMNQYNRG